MGSLALFAKGTQLQVELTPSVFSDIPELKQVAGPSLESDEVDVTTHDVTGDFRFFLRGLIDPGEISADLAFNPSNSIHQALYADLLSGARRNYRVRWPFITPVYRLDFEGFVRSFPITSPVDADLQAALTIRVVGNVVLLNE